MLLLPSVSPGLCWWTVVLFSNLPKPPCQWHISVKSSATSLKKMLSKTLRQNATTSSSIISVSVVFLDRRNTTLSLPSCYRDTSLPCPSPATVWCRLYLSSVVLLCRSSCNSLRFMSCHYHYFSGHDQDDLRDYTHNRLTHFGSCKCWHCQAKEYEWDKNKEVWERKFPRLHFLVLFWFSSLFIGLLIIVLLYLLLNCVVDVDDLILSGVRIRCAKKGIFLMSWDMKVEIEQKVGHCLFFPVVPVSWSLAILPHALIDFVFSNTHCLISSSPYLPPSFPYHRL